MLRQRLAQAGDVAVAEDAEASGEESLPRAVAFHLLDGEEAHEGLGDGEGQGFGHAGLSVFMRGSKRWSLDRSRSPRGRSPR